jgi:hypothetical protein
MILMTRRDTDYGNEFIRRKTPAEIDLRPDDSMKRYWRSDRGIFGHTETEGEGEGDSGFWCIRKFRVERRGSVERGKSMLMLEKG